jgi:pyruvate formate lyase activating enzyme
VESCPAGALQYTGREVSVEEVVEEVLQDKNYYDLSKGGVTLSGGEPLMQPEFSKAVLEGCKLMGIHTAIETSLFAPWESVEMVLPYVDLIMFDIKHIESSVHKRVTGVSNELILENARKLLFEAKVPLIVRTPIVPTVNDSGEVVVKIAEFIRGSSNLEYYELLPFHKLGQSKYQNLGLEYPAKDLERPSKEKMLELARAAEGVGVKVRVGRV